MPAIFKVAGMEGESHDRDDIMLWAAGCICFFDFLGSGEAAVLSLKEYNP